MEGETIKLQAARFFSRASLKVTFWRRAGKKAHFGSNIFFVVELITGTVWTASGTGVCVCSPKDQQQPHNRTRRTLREGKKAAPLHGLCADGAAFLAQGCRAPTLDLIFFHVGCTVFCCSWGCSLCAGPPPLLEEKTCMISYMKDICNWTAGPMQYIYNSKQRTLQPVSPSPPPFSLLLVLLPEEMHLHTFRKHNIKKKQTQHRLSFLLPALYLMNVENAQAPPVALAGGPNHGAWSDISVIASQRHRAASEL